MSLSFSTYLKNKWLKAAADSAPLGTIINLSEIRIFKGVRPTNADAVCSSANLLVSILSGATGLTFENAASGIMVKAAAEVWSGVVAAAGTATWFRLFVKTEDPYAAVTTTLARIDGNVGEGTEANIDLYLADTALVATGSPTLTIDVFQITLP